MTRASARFGMSPKNGPQARFAAPVRQAAVRAPRAIFKGQFNGLSGIAGRQPACRARTAPENRP